MGALYISFPREGGRPTLLNSTPIESVDRSLRILVGCMRTRKQRRKIIKEQVNIDNVLSDSEQHIGHGFIIGFCWVERLCFAYGPRYGARVSYRLSRPCQKDLEERESVCLVGLENQ